jgi:hypothetical protein
MKQRSNFKLASEKVNYPSSHCFEKCVLFCRNASPILNNPVPIQSEDCLSAVLLRALPGKSEDFSFCMKQWHNIQIHSRRSEFSIISLLREMHYEVLCQLSMSSWPKPKIHIKLTQTTIKFKNSFCPHSNRSPNPNAINSIRSTAMGWKLMIEQVLPFAFGHFIKVF